MCVIGKHDKYENKTFLNNNNDNNIHVNNMNRTPPPHNEMCDFHLNCRMSSMTKHHTNQQLIMGHHSTNVCYAKTLLWKPTKALLALAIVSSSDRTTKHQTNLKHFSFKEYSIYQLRQQYTPLLHRCDHKRITAFFSSFITE